MVDIAEINVLQLELVDYSLYFSNLAFSDFLLFMKFKMYLERQRYSSDEKVAAPDVIYFA